MLQSKLFTKTRREDPKDEVAKNAKLLVRAGFIHKEAAGIYSLLPLGLRTINKINNIVREEMNALGANELQMTALQNPDIWQKTDRWSDDKVDNWFKTSLKGGGELGLGFTHEEDITAIASAHVNSYKDLPFSAYQIQTKFRNEARAKSGIMRGREFLMKDLYSFHVSEADLEIFYAKATEAYQNIFKRLGIGDKTFLTFASGGVFSEFSHEFQTICEVGEDTIYIDREKQIAVNQEVYNDEVLTKLGLNKNKLEEVKAVEIGNIFKLGTRFSEPLGLTYVDEKGERQLVIMGSYGFGPSRAMGLLTEVLADDQGLVWPLSVAPFALHLISLDQNEKALELYKTLTAKGVEVLLDDREASAGAKFADADLIGIPYRVIISAKGLADNKYEVKNRATGEVQMVSVDEFEAWVEKTIQL